jgi:serine/threonine protein kinase
MKKPKQVKTTFASYTLGKCMGEGGAGIVYSATEDGGSPVAVKMLRTDSREKLKRFKNEYIFCSRNTHVNIITVSDHGTTEEGAPFYVMPLYRESLRDVIGKLDPKAVFKVFEKILNGVDAAHKLGTIHRDLKPENILINGTGIDDDLVIADFGIAEFEQDEIYTSVETKDGTRLGNFPYAAPEQRARGRKIDKQADIYALGLILNELFTNELAHGTGFKTIKSTAEEYSYLDPIVERMLHQNPASRYADIDELKKELNARGAEQVSMQKLSRLKSTVIPTNKIDDPIAYDPMRIVNVDWNNGILNIILNHHPSPGWVSALRNIGNYTSIMGKGPDVFQFSDRSARISAGQYEAQDIIDYFKQWLPKADTLYLERIKQKLAQAERKQREELQDRVKQEEIKAEVMRNLKF